LNKILAIIFSSFETSQKKKRRSEAVGKLTPAGNNLSTYFLKVAKKSETKSAKRSFASQTKILDILTRSFASRFELPFALPLLAKKKWTNYWSFYPQGLSVGPLNK
jgi:hypothetical protein